jgi:hypothetical protein
MKKALFVLAAIIAVNSARIGANASEAKITSPWLPLSGVQLTFVLPRRFSFEELDDVGDWRFTDYTFKAKRGEVVVVGEILQYGIGRAWTHGALDGESVRLANGFRGVWQGISDPDDWLASLCVKTIQNRCVIVEISVPRAEATPTLRAEVRAALKATHFYRHLKSVRANS